MKVSGHQPAMPVRRSFSGAFIHRLTIYRDYNSKLFLNRIHIHLFIPQLLCGMTIR